MILEIIGVTIGKQLRFVDESPEDSRAGRQRKILPGGWDSYAYTLQLREGIKRVRRIWIVLT
jgi:hypothetical protein